jgi:hypothetical protein
MVKGSIIVHFEIDETDHTAIPKWDIEAVGPLYTKHSGSSYLRIMSKEREYQVGTIGGDGNFPTTLMINLDRAWPPAKDTPK